MKHISKLSIGFLASCVVAVLPFSAMAGDDEEKMGAKEDVQESHKVFQQMKADADLKQAFDQAKAVFIIPDYATAALIVGGSGGEGVLVTKADGEWSHPAFYDVGSVSAGLQAGVAAGSVGLLVMTDKALQEFEQRNNFSLTSAAGLSIFNWSKRAQGEWGDGNDIIAWTDTEGLFGEISLAISDIHWDEEENQAYYGQPVTPTQLLKGDVENPNGLQFSQVDTRPRESRD